MKKSRSRKTGTQGARKPRQKPTAPLGVYCNHVNVQFGCAEMSVTFSQTRPEVSPTEGLQWPITEVTRLTIPPETAKVLAFELLSNIATFETLLGPVNLAPQLVPLMPAAGVLSPDTIARLAVLHYELFAPVPTSEPARPIQNNDLGPHVTKH